MTIFGKRLLFNNGSYFYTKIQDRTVFRIEIAGKRSCWLVSDDNYEDIKNNHHYDHDIPVNIFPEWIFNGIHFGSVDYCKISAHPKFYPVLHIDGIEWNANGTLCVIDYREEEILSIYDEVMKKYIKGFCHYMPIITLD